MNIDIKKIETTCQEFGNDSEKIRAKKKSLQSIKTRLNKMKSREDYDQKMAEVLEQIETLTQCINFLEPKEKFVTAYDQSDIDKLDFDQTQKAIKSIQSAICNNQFNEELYSKYKKIEVLLLEHKKLVKPVEDAYVRKTDLQKLIDKIESTTDISVETILKDLKNLI